MPSMPLILEMLVVLPLCVGVICVLLAGLSKQFPFFLVLIALSVSMLMAACLFYHIQVYDDPVFTHVGNWKAPLGILLALDSFNSVILLLFCVFALSFLPMVENLRKRDCSTIHPGLFYAMISWWFTGVVGVIITADAFNLFVFLEIMALTSYVLVALGGQNDRKALHVAFSYLLLGSVGASFYLIGIGFLLWETGVLNFQDIINTLPEASHNMTVVAAASFMITGLALKAAIFPAHSWLPYVYQYAPGSISTLLAGIGTKIYLYALIKILFTLLGNNFSYHSFNLEIFLIPCAVLSILVPSWKILYEKNIHRMLSFSSITHMGYILLSVSLHSLVGLTAAIVHFIGHACTKGSLFAIASYVKSDQKHLERNDLNGLYHRSPLLAILFTIALLSLVGLPGTFGFISKWLLLESIWEQQTLWPIVIVIAVGTVLSLIYSWSLIERMFFGENKEHGKLSTPLMIFFPLIALMFLIILWGLFPLAWWAGAPLDIARTAAKTLLSGLGSINY